jgi:hypothetical protein
VPSKVDTSKPKKGGPFGGTPAEKPIGPKTVGGFIERASSNAYDTLKGTNKFGRSLNQNSTLAVMLVVFLIITAENFDSGSFSFKEYLAWYLVFVILTTVAEFGESAARLAAAIAIVSMLYLLVSRRDPIVNVIKKFAGVSGSLPPQLEQQSTPMLPAAQTTQVLYQGRIVT